MLGCDCKIRDFYVLNLIELSFFFYMPSKTYAFSYKRGDCFQEVRPGKS